jgi:hypothetical protein
MTLPDHEDDDADDAITCALFVDGLPSDFAGNIQLAALAKLCETEGEAPMRDPSILLEPEGSPCDTTNSKIQTTVGKSIRSSGKARKENARDLRRNANAPYKVPPTISGRKHVESDTTISELNLFMKLWKP